MKKIGLGIKIGLLLLITVVLQLPISLIKNIVAERQDNQTQVTQQLSKNVGGEQLIYRDERRNDCNPPLKLVIA